ncbi:hypothetical protein NW762_013725 [Fusarium torreyae]|uniref:Ketoreductase domain-containing protein n=1 Tax=Fusarium torreyae TaxID=1237075 RepID=A0A9W8RMV2_9HYPO|nr:hypothetical protein NW762_013725 [Fusarium torreyae]
MSRPVPSYTKIVHTKSYDGINPRLPSLSTSGKVVVITGASGGIGRATACSFAASGPKALILLGRNSSALEETVKQVKSALGSSGESLTIVRSLSIDLLDSPKLRDNLASIVVDLGSIDVVVHCAGHLPPIKPLLEVDPSHFLDGFEMTLTGTLAIAQAVILANGAAFAGESAADQPKKQVRFLNLTTAGALFPPFPGMGIYVTCKLAVIKMLEAFAVEKPQMRVINVHPGFLQTNMSTQLAERGVHLPFAFDDISLPSDFLVWAASPYADFLHGKIVFAAWDVNELLERKAEIAQPSVPGGGALALSYQGFARYLNGSLIA